MTGARTIWDELGGRGWRLEESIARLKRTRLARELVDESEPEGWTVREVASVLEEIDAS